jgi:hypothetical protein
MAAKDFEELALDGHNYPTWAMDIKISLSSRGIAGALIPPENPPQEGDAQVTEQQKYTALSLIRQHIHPDSIFLLFLCCFTGSAILLGYHVKSILTAGSVYFYILP